MNFFVKTYHLLFFIGLFLLPFNSEIPEFLSFLGEYSADSSPIFFLGSFMVFMITIFLGRKFYLPYKSVEINLMLIFVLSLLFSTILNLPEIQNYYFKHTTGVERFFRQFISLSFSCFIFLLLFVNICYDYGALGFFLLTRKVFLYSLIIVFFVGCLEFIIINFNLPVLEPVIYIADYFPFTNITLNYRLKRVSSLTYEPPALGTYLLTISGFMFSYIYTSKSNLKKYIPILLVVFLALVSKSRTAFVVIIIQLMIGVLLTYLNSHNFRKLIKIVVSSTILIAIIIGMFFSKNIYNSLQERFESLDFTQLKYSSDNHSVSNKSRLGMQVAMFEVFKENPIFGVGWGQQAYVSRKHYPKWAVKNNYEFPQKYQNQQIKSFPPSFNLYLRILTETGIMGLLFFLFFLGSICFALYKKYIITSIKQKPFIICLIIGFAGFFLNWFQIDSFRIYGFWLCLSLLILIPSVSKNEKLYAK